MKALLSRIVLSLLFIAGSAALNAAESREARDERLAKFVGSAAPDFTPTATIGDFKNLAHLKGKVVMLDLFAHWCGPCIASFPSVRTLQDEFGSKGFQVVGLTRYYGYYKTENRTKRDMPPATELERVKQFAEEKKMNWPIVFTDKSVFEAYGCTGIPHVVLIDRAGKIRKVKVGYNPKDVAAFQAEVEKLLAEPAKP